MFLQEKKFEFFDSGIVCTVNEDCLNKVSFSSCIESCNQITVGMIKMLSTLMKSLNNKNKTTI